MKLTTLEIMGSIMADITQTQTSIDRSNMYGPPAVLPKTEQRSKRLLSRILRTEARRCKTTEGSEILLGIAYEVEESRYQLVEGCNGLAEIADNLVARHAN